MYTNEISWHVESWADRLKAVQCIYRGSFAYSTCKIYQNMEIGIVLYTLETIASIRSLCILRASFSLEVWNLRRSIGCLLRQRPDSFYHSEQRFNRSFIHSFDHFTRHYCSRGIQRWYSWTNLARCPHPIQRNRPPVVRHRKNRSSQPPLVHQWRSPRLSCGGVRLATNHCGAKDAIGSQVVASLCRHYCCCGCGSA